MSDIPAYRSITFLKGYTVKKSQLLDSKTGTYQQTFHGKPNEDFTVEMKNGRYDGEGILRKNGIIKMIFTFSPKEGENHVLVYNDEGEIIFQGNEKNNLKSGVCIEYHNGIVRFIGMYKNGVRNGYGCSYNEFGEIEFVGRWKDDAKTNSPCNEEFFLYSIKPTMGYSTTNYEKAVFPLSKEFLLISGLLFILALILIGIQHFHNSPRSRTVHLSNGAIWNGTVIQSNPNGNGFYYHSNHSLYYHGNCWNGYFHGNGTMYYGDGITKHFEGIWEYGYLKEGSLFNEKGDLQYSGQFQSNIPHGIGRSYINHSIQFEGIWYYGSDIRGRYYANNKVYFEKQKQGLSNILIMNTTSDNVYCSYKITKIVIHDDLMNKESDIEMNVSNCLNVEEIVIGNNCGKYITRFIISNLSKLRTIIIGSNSFTRLDYSSQSFLDNLGRIADENHIFIIQNCSSLEAITIGSHSFSDYYHFQLESKLFLTFFIIGLPSLVSLVIGTRSHSRRENYFSYNFIYMDEFVIENLPNLNSIVLGNGVAALASKHIFRSMNK